MRALLVLIVITQSVFAGYQIHGEGNFTWNIHNSVNKFSATTIDLGFTAAPFYPEDSLQVLIELTSSSYQEGKVPIVLQELHYTFSGVVTTSLGFQESLKTKTLRKILSYKELGDGEYLQRFDDEFTCAGVHSRYSVSDYVSIDAMISFNSIYKVPEGPYNYTISGTAQLDSISFYAIAEYADSEVAFQSDSENESDSGYVVSGTSAVTYSSQEWFIGAMIELQIANYESVNLLITYSLFGKYALNEAFLLFSKIEHDRYSNGDESTLYFEHGVDYRFKEHFSLKLLHRVKTFSDGSRDAEHLLALQFSLWFNN